MWFSSFKGVVILIALASTTGCVVKTNLGPIPEDLKPAAKLSGKVHVMPLEDKAQINQFDGYYTTVSGAAEKTKYVSASNPSDNLSKSITTCLTQSGLVVTTGNEVPQDTDMVLAPTFRYLYIGTSVGYNIAMSMITGMATSSTPYAQIAVWNTIEDRRANAKTDAVFYDWKRGFAFTDSGLAEQAFQNVQEIYCGWLQKKMAAFKADPAAAETVNRKEASAVLKSISR